MQQEGKPTYYDVISNVVKSLESQKLIRLSGSNYRVQNKSNIRNLGEFKLRPKWKRGFARKITLDEIAEILGRRIPYLPQPQKQYGAVLTYDIPLNGSSDRINIEYP